MRECQKHSLLFTMTLKQQAQKELSRIKKSMAYRQKKYGINFPTDKNNISERILGRQVKYYTKRDIEKLKQIRGTELYRFGEVNLNGETVKGYKTEDIAKSIRKFKRITPQTTYITKEPQIIIPLTDEEVKAKREEKIRKLQEAIERSIKKEQENRNKFVSASEQIIENFLNPSYWNKLTDRANNILKGYVSNVISSNGKDDLANAIEVCASSGELFELRTYWYRWGMSTALSMFLEPYFGQKELLEDFDREMNEDMEEQLLLTDYEQAMSVFGR